MMVDRHFIDSNGNYFIATDVEENYHPEGALSVPQRPSPLHIWLDDEWVKGAAPAADNILSAPASGFGGPSMKELFNGNR